MNPPSKPLYDMMVECTAQTKQDFEFEGQLIRNIGGMYIALFANIDEEKIESSSQRAALYLTIRTFRFFQCAINNAYDGYYEVAMSLLRNVYENDILSSYLGNNELRAQKWLDGKNSFSQEWLRDKLGKKEGPYKALSTHFAHPNKFESILQILRKASDGTTDLIIYPEYDKEKCELVFHLGIMLGWSSLMHLNHPFKEYLSKNKQWKLDYHSWNKIMLEYIEERIVKKSSVKFRFENKLPEL